MTLTANTPRRPRGRPVVGTRKDFPIHGLIDEDTRKGVEALIARRQETQSGFVRRAVRELLEREMQAA